MAIPMKETGKTISLMVKEVKFFPMGIALKAILLLDINRAREFILGKKDSFTAMLEIIKKTRYLVMAPCQ